MDDAAWVGSFDETHGCKGRHMVRSVGHSHIAIPVRWCNENLFA